MRVLALAVVVCAGCAAERARPGASEGVHGPGVLDPASPDFHGRQLEAHGWDLGLCAGCHGEDFAGGAAEVSCVACHQDGPTACDTCHEAQPTSGAHANHAARVDCATCHRVPGRWDDEGHVRRGGLADPPPAEVEMTGLAAVTLDAADRSGPPAYAAGTCSNVYCHGAVLHQPSAAGSTPTWTASPGPAACDGCHGNPPARGHVEGACEQCHPGGSRHLDGAITLGDAPGCGGCHGSAASSAPPRDLSGEQFTTALGVGAHQAHLQATRRLSVPIACGTCHQVPTTLGATGHIDSARPAEVNAALGWDRALGSCGTAWCHGGPSPVWTSSGQVFCGSCHPIPPPTAPHTAAMTLGSCAGCHPETVDEFGNILITDLGSGRVSRHLDGVVDAP